MNLRPTRQSRRRYHTDRAVVLRRLYCTHGKNDGEAAPRDNRELYNSDQYNTKINE
jgi:hypothetical protein